MDGLGRQESVRTRRRPPGGRILAGLLSWRPFLGMDINGDRPHSPLLDLRDVQKGAGIKDAARTSGDLGSFPIQYENVAHRKGRHATSPPVAL